MQGKVPVSFLDCLFTATSAVCVTGLITVDTATAWSSWGKSLILLLIQMGGLGIMTYGVALLHLSGQKPSPKTHQTLSRAFGSVPGQQVHTLAKDVVIYTLCLELIGTLLLWLRFAQDYAWPKALALAGFHCISAFCNAGFSLFSDSLVDYAHDPIVNIVILFLIVAGGIGFLVMRELVTRLRIKKNARPKRLTLNTRLVLLSSLGLFVGGALVLAFFEFLADGGEVWNKGAWPIIFTALTPRTAGFNTIEISQLSNASILVVMLLMFIGASPGSCGGGVKTTTFAVLALLVKNRMQGKGWAGMSGRAISGSQLANALALVMCSLVVVFAGSLALVSLELNQTPLAEARGEALVMAFEAVSAFGTVGLSMGATGHLTWGGKLVVIALMFIGRIGPLTFVYSLSKRVAARSYGLAEERVMVG
jgi:trk system potassium uptake protein TrkH